MQTQCASAFSFLRVGLCLHDRTSISLAACSALVAVRCPKGAPTARIKPTPAAAAAAAAALSFRLKKKGCEREPEYVCMCLEE